MKRINWQRLATIGLCSSLVINAFSGVTAIAETVTSESSRQWQIVLRKQHQQVAQGKKVRKAVKKRLKRVRKK